MKILETIFGNGGVSREQGKYYDPAQVSQSIPKVDGLKAGGRVGKSSITKKDINYAKGLLPDPIVNIGPPILEGNARKKVSLGRFTIYPKGQHEALHPQKRKGGR